LAFDDFQALYTLFVELTKPIHSKEGTGFADTEQREGSKRKVRDVVIVEDSDRWLKEVCYGLPYYPLRVVGQLLDTQFSLILRSAS